MSRRLERPTSLPSVSSPATRISAAQSDLDAVLASESDLEFPIEELREFLSADLFEVPADPEFKEQLRERLWGMLKQRTHRRKASGGD